MDKWNEGQWVRTTKRLPGPRGMIPTGTACEIVHVEGGEVYILPLRYIADRIEEMSPDDDCIQPDEYIDGIGAIERI